MEPSDLIDKSRIRMESFEYEAKLLEMKADELLKRANSYSIKSGYYLLNYNERQHYIKL